MSWIVEVADEFEPEIQDLPNDVQEELLAIARLLQRFGPQLKRPHADTMNHSRHANMKELRFNAADEYGVWLLLLIRNAEPFCLWRETNQVTAKRGSIVG